MSSSPDYIFDKDELTIKYKDAELEVIVNEKGIPMMLEEMNTDYTPPRNISLEVRDSPIVDQLEKWGFTIPPSSRKLDRFFAVVEALNTIHTTTDYSKWGHKITKGTRWKIPIPNDPPQRTNGKLTGGSTLGDKKNIQGGFLKIAKLAGILGAVGEKETPETAKAQTKPAQKMEQDFKKFQGEWTDPKDYKKHRDAGGEQNYVYEWQNTIGAFKDKGSPKAKTLYKALTLLDLSPEEFLRASKDPTVGIRDKTNPEKIAWLTDRMEQPTFKAGGKQAKRYPDKISLVDWSALEKPVPTLVDKKIKNPKSGKMELKTVEFSRERPKGFQEGSRGVLKGLTLVMRHLAESHGVSGAWGELWSQKTPKAKKGSLNLSATELEKFENCLKTKPTFDKDGFYIFEEDVEDEYDEREYLDKKKEKPNPNYGEQLKETYRTTKEDWENAYLYYKIGMDMGWRAEEGFTAVGNKPKNVDKDSGVVNEGWKEMREDMILKNEYGYTGSYDRAEMDKFYEELKEKTIENYKEKFPDNPDLARSKGIDELYTIRSDVQKRSIESENIALQIMTRKTAHVRDIIHKGFIQNEEAKKLIKAKLAKIEEGAKQPTQAKADKFGVILKYTDNTVVYRLGKWQPSETYGKQITNHYHSLIGADDYYTKVGTLQFGADPKFSTAERQLFKKNTWTIPRVAKIAQNRKKMRAIFRQCYKEALEKGQVLDNYFLKHSLHAIRHLFAQYWIKSSNKDYTFVAKLGHWGGTDVLQNFYGEASGAETLELQIKFGKKKFSDLKKIEEDDKKTEEVRKKTDEFLGDDNADGNTENLDDPEITTNTEEAVVDE